MDGTLIEIRNLKSEFRNSKSEINGTADEEYVMAFPQGSERAEYAMRIEVRKIDITGILVLRLTPEGEIRGAMMNEFGVSALNLLITPDRKKVRLLNVSSLLNKWYIKRAIRADMRYLFRARMSDVGQKRKGRRIDITDEGITLYGRHGITYQFTQQTEPIQTDDDETTE